MARFLAFIVLLIPILATAAGIKLMRDTIFSILIEPFPFLWLQFLVGIILFLAGFFFLAGFLLNRDRKNGKVSERFMKNKQAK